MRLLIFILSIGLASSVYWAAIDEWCNEQYYYWRNGVNTYCNTFELPWNDPIWCGHCDKATATICHTVEERQCFACTENTPSEIEWNEMYPTDYYDHYRGPLPDYTGWGGVTQKLKKDTCLTNTHQDTNHLNFRSEQCHRFQCPDYEYGTIKLIEREKWRIATYGTIIPIKECSRERDDAKITYTNCRQCPEGSYLPVEVWNVPDYTAYLLDRQSYDQPCIPWTICGKHADRTSRGPFDADHKTPGTCEPCKDGGLAVDDASNCLICGNQVDGTPRGLDPGGVSCGACAEGSFSVGEQFDCISWDLDEVTDLSGMCSDMYKMMVEVADVQPLGFNYMQNHYDDCNQGDWNCASLLSDQWDAVQEKCSKICLSAGYELMYTENNYQYYGERYFIPTDEYTKYKEKCYCITNDMRSMTGVLTCENTGNEWIDLTAPIHADYPDKPHKVLRPVLDRDLPFLNCDTYADPELITEAPAPEGSPDCKNVNLVKVNQALCDSKCSRMGQYFLHDGTFCQCEGGAGNRAPFIEYSSFDVFKIVDTDEYNNRLDEYISEAVCREFALHLNVPFDEASGRPEGCSADIRDEAVVRLFYNPDSGTTSCFVDNDDGFCSDNSFTDQSTCESGVHTWTDGSCTDGASTDQSTCESTKHTWTSANCPDGSSTDKSECEAIKYEWTPGSCSVDSFSSIQSCEGTKVNLWIDGSCTDGITDNQYDCEKFIADWTPESCSDGISTDKSTCESTKHTWVTQFCSDGQSLDSQSCESNKHIWTLDSCSMDSRVSQDKCESITGTWTPDACSDGVGQDKNICESTPHTWVLGSCSTDTITDKSTCEMEKHTWAQGPPGSCSDGVSSSSACENAPVNTWTPGSCSWSNINDRQTCIVNSGTWTPGSCTATIGDQPTCEAPRHTWDPAFCTDVTITDQGTCESSSATWTPDSCSDGTITEESTCEATSKYTWIPAHCGVASVTEQSDCEEAWRNTNWYPDTCCNGDDCTDGTSNIMSAYTTQSACEAPKHTWTPQFCSDDTITDQSTCEEKYTWTPESCSDATSADKSTCEAAQANTWSPPYCTDGTSADQSTCEAQWHTWTPQFCSIDTFSDQSTCESTSSVWTEEFCSNTLYAYKVSCEMSGNIWTPTGCSDGTSTDQSTCEQKFTWTPAFCSDGISADQSTCEATPVNTWTPDSCSDGISIYQNTCEVAPVNTWSENFCSVNTAASEAICNFYGGAWTEGSCPDGIGTTRGDCEATQVNAWIPAHCSDDTLTDQNTCEGTSVDTWTPGSCTDGISTDQSTCEAARANTWTISTDMVCLSTVLPSSACVRDGFTRYKTSRTCVNKNRRCEGELSIYLSGDTCYPCQDNTAITGYHRSDFVASNYIGVREGSNEEMILSSLLNEKYLTSTGSCSDPTWTYVEQCERNGKIWSVGSCESLCRDYKGFLNTPTRTINMNRIVKDNSHDHSDLTYEQCKQYKDESLYNYEFEEITNSDLPMGCFITHNVTDPNSPDKLYFNHETSTTGKCGETFEIKKENVDNSWSNNQVDFPDCDVHNGFNFACKHKEGCFSWRLGADFVMFEGYNPGGAWDMYNSWEYKRCYNYHYRMPCEDDYTDGGGVYNEYNYYGHSYGYCLSEYAWCMKIGRMNNNIALGCNADDDIESDYWCNGWSWKFNASKHDECYALYGTDTFSTVSTECLRDQSFDLDYNCECVAELDLPELAHGNEEVYEKHYETGTTYYEYDRSCKAKTYPCQPGYRVAQPSPGSVSENVCIPCERGSWNDDGLENCFPSPVECPKGSEMRWIDDSFPYTSPNICDPCPIDPQQDIYYYQPTVGTDQCMKKKRCGPGEEPDQLENPSVDTQCIPCPAKHFSNTTDYERCLFISENRDSCNLRNSRFVDGDSVEDNYCIPCPENEFAYGEFCYKTVDRYQDDYVEFIDETYSVCSGETVTVIFNQFSNLQEVTESGYNLYSPDTKIGNPIVGMHYKYSSFEIDTLGAPDGETRYFVNTGTPSKKFRTECDRPISTTKYKYDPYHASAQCNAINQKYNVASHACDRCEAHHKAVNDTCFTDRIRVSGVLTKIPEISVACSVGQIAIGDKCYEENSIIIGGVSVPRHIDYQEVTIFIHECNRRWDQPLYKYIYSRYSMYRNECADECPQNKRAIGDLCTIMDYQGMAENRMYFCRSLNKAVDNWDGLNWGVNWQYYNQDRGQCGEYCNHRIADKGMCIRKNWFRFEGEMITDLMFKYHFDLPIETYSYVQQSCEWIWGVYTCTGGGARVPIEDVITICNAQNKRFDPTSRECVPCPADEFAFGVECKIVTPRPCINCHRDLDCEHCMNDPDCSACDPGCAYDMYRKVRIGEDCYDVRRRVIEQPPVWDDEIVAEKPFKVTDFNFISPINLAMSAGGAKPYGFRVLIKTSETLAVDNLDSPLTIQLQNQGSLYPMPFNNDFKITSLDGGDIETVIGEEGCYVMQNEAATSVRLHAVLFSKQIEAISMWLTGDIVPDEDILIVCHLPSKLTKLPENEDLTAIFQYGTEVLDEFDGPYELQFRPETCKKEDSFLGLYGYVVDSETSWESTDFQLTAKCATGIGYHGETSWDGSGDTIEVYSCPGTLNEKLYNYPNWRDERLNNPIPGLDFIVFRAGDPHTDPTNLFQDYGDKDKDPFRGVTAVGCKMGFAKPPMNYEGYEISKCNHLMSGFGECCGCPDNKMNRYDLARYIDQTQYPIGLGYCSDSESSYKGTMDLKSCDKSCMNSTHFFHGFDGSLNRCYCITGGNKVPRTCSNWVFAQQSSSKYITYKTSSQIRKGLTKHTCDTEYTTDFYSCGQLNPNAPHGQEITDNYEAFSEMDDMCSAEVTCADYDGYTYDDTVDMSCADEDKWLDDNSYFGVSTTNGWNNDWSTRSKMRQVDVQFTEENFNPDSPFVWGEYTVRGCRPETCIPTTDPAFIYHGERWVGGLERKNFGVQVRCAPGYVESLSGIQTTRCSTDSTEFFVSGCRPLICVPPAFNVTGYVLSNETATLFTQPSGSCGDGYAGTFVAELCTEEGDEYIPTGCVNQDYCNKRRQPFLSTGCGDLCPETQYASGDQCHDLITTCTADQIPLGGTNYSQHTCKDISCGMCGISHWRCSAPSNGVDGIDWLRNTLTDNTYTPRKNFQPVASCTANFVGTPVIEPCQNNEANTLQSGCTEAECVATTTPGYTHNSGYLGIGTGQFAPVVTCAEDYHGTPIVTPCTEDGAEYTVSGCEPNVCASTTDPAYNVTENDLTALSIEVAIGGCTSLYKPTQDDYSVTKCTEHGGDYVLGGCEPRLCATPTGLNMIFDGNVGIDQFDITVTSCMDDYIPSSATPHTATVCTGENLPFVVNGECIPGSCSTPENYEVIGGSTFMPDFAPELRCAQGFSGNPTATKCTQDANYFSASGCDPNGCVAPDIAGYDYPTDKVSSADIPYAINCASGYYGTGSITGCSAEDQPYTVSGCIPPSCVHPSDTEYSFDGGDLSIENFAPVITCALGYHGPPVAVVCSQHDQEYTVTGCDPNDCVHPTVAGYETGDGDLNTLNFSPVVTCAADYHGNPVATPCVDDQGEYTLTGCSENVCAETTVAGYTQTTGNLNVLTFSVSLDCETGYHGSPEATKCTEHGEEYVVSGCDSNECLPPSTAGYDVGTNTVTIADFTPTVACAADYHGTPVATPCTDDQTEYTVAGCEPNVCIQTTAAGYTHIDGDLNALTFAPNLECALDYHGTPSATKCTTHGGEYNVDGCEEDVCQTSTNPGYTHTGGSLNVLTFSATVECTSDYHGTAEATKCLQHDHEIVVSGCEGNDCVHPSTVGYTYDAASSDKLNILDFGPTVACADYYHGTPEATKCSVDGGEYSVSGCEENVCVCDHGTLSNDNCPIHGEQNCATCNTGYWLNGVVCEAHADCPAGQGTVNYDSEADTNTVCEDCTGDPSYNNANDKSPCGDHVGCAADAAFYTYAPSGDLCTPCTDNKKAIGKFETTCSPTCTEPSSIFGYVFDGGNLNAGAVFAPVISCQNGFHGTPVATPCEISDEDYTVTGCEPSNCAFPSTPGYNFKDSDIFYDGKTYQLCDGDSADVTWTGYHNIIEVTQAGYAAEDKLTQFGDEVHGYESGTDGAPLVKTLTNLGAQPRTTRYFLCETHTDKKFAVTCSARSIPYFNAFAECADGYDGSPQVQSCTQKDEPFVVSGCVTDTCVAPTTEGYAHNGGDLSLINFNPTVACAEGFEGTPSATVCSADGEAYTVDGCTPQACETLWNSPDTSKPEHDIEVQPGFYILIDGVPKTHGKLGIFDSSGDLIFSMDNAGFEATWANYGGNFGDPNRWYYKAVMYAKGRLTMKYSPDCTEIIELSPSYNALTPNDNPLITLRNSATVTIEIPKGYFGFNIPVVPDDLKLKTLFGTGADNDDRIIATSLNKEAQYYDITYPDVNGDQQRYQSWDGQLANLDLPTFVKITSFRSENPKTLVLTGAIPSSVDYTIPSGFSGFGIPGVDNILITDLFPGEWENGDRIICTSQAKEVQYYDIPYNDENGDPQRYTSWDGQLTFVRPMDGCTVYKQTAGSYTLTL